MYFVTMLELDGHEICRGNFKDFKQSCQTMYLHRGDQVLGRIFADDNKVDLHADNGEIKHFERKEFEVLYAKDGDLKFCKKITEE